MIATVSSSSAMRLSSPVASQSCRLVGAGAVAELLDEERVRQEAAVERDVGVRRQAVLVPERDERDRHRIGVGPLDQVAQRRAQLVHRERARIEDPVGDFAQPAQALALASDALL